MKTLIPRFLLPTIATVMVTSGLSANEKPNLDFPVGDFQVNFMNGVVEHCEFSKDASVIVSQKNRTSTGRIEMNDGKVLVHYEDDRLEEWMPVDQAYIVNHWHPASKRAEKGQPMMGFAEKKLEGNVEVHEWGTFTVLQGTNGKAIKWYQAPEKIVDLPSFVKREFTTFGKARSPNLFTGLDSVRMETPVLYFYPEKEMDIRVSASFPNGRITEVFPPTSYQFNRGNSSLWRGTLLPPDAQEKSRVPAATGPKGRHYAAARAVPDAWLFSQLSPGSTPPKSKDPQKPVAEPIDHFIFYRGAGNADHFPIRAVERQEAGSYKLSNYYHKTIPKLFALRVEDGKSSWTTINHLARVGYDKEKKIATNQQDFDFPKKSGPVNEVAAELSDAMVAAMHAEGLTLDEAKSMVATWDNLWFTDPGTRILAILPQSFADEMVPLHIEPKPSKLERVFVARLELINRAQEQILSKVLNPSDELSENVASEQLSSLQLGRYSAGGMERAKTLIAAEIQKRFARLEKLNKEREAIKDASAKLTK